MERRQKFLLQAVLAAILCSPPLFAASSAEPQRDPAAERKIAARESEDDEYNFSWLDPDKKVYVLQNRKYRKKGKPALFLSGGMNLTNPYRSEYLGVLRAGFWFTEQLGIEGFFALISNSNNGNLNALRNSSPTALPFVREHRNYFAAVGTFTPWYSKLNFFNKILYFDWFFNLGGGQVSTAFDQNRRADQGSDFKSENIFALFYGTGMNFFVTKQFSVRLDLIGMLYSATGADNQTKRTVSNYDFTAGVGYAFF